MKMMMSTVKIRVQKGGITRKREVENRISRRKSRRRNKRVPSITIK